MISVAPSMTVPSVKQSSIYRGLGGSNSCNSSSSNGSNSVNGCVGESIAAGWCRTAKKAATDSPRSFDACENEGDDKFTAACNQRQKSPSPQQLEQQVQQHSQKQQLQPQQQQQQQQEKPAMRQQRHQDWERLANLQRSDVTTQESRRSDISARLSQLVTSDGRRSSASSSSLNNDMEEARLIIDEEGREREEGGKEFSDGDVNSHNEMALRSHDFISQCHNDVMRTRHHDFSRQDNSDVIGQYYDDAVLRGKYAKKQIECNQSNGTGHEISTNDNFTRNINSKEFPLQGRAYQAQMSSQERWKPDDLRCRGQDDVPSPPGEGKTSPGERGSLTGASRGLPRTTEQQLQQSPLNDTMAEDSSETFFPSPTRFSPADLKPGSGGIGLDGQDFIFEGGRNRLEFAKERVIGAEGYEKFRDDDNDDEDENVAYSPSSSPAGAAGQLAFKNDDIAYYKEYFNSTYRRNDVVGYRRDVVGYDDDDESYDDRRHQLRRQDLQNPAGGSGGRGREEGEEKELSRPPPLQMLQQLNGGGYMGRLPPPLEAPESDNLIGRGVLTHQRRVGEDGDVMISNAKDIFSCHLCDFVGRTDLDYASHMRSTHFKNQCPYCGYSSRTIGRLRRHVTDFHSTTSGVVGGAFGGKKTKRQRILKCRECSFTTLDQNDYWRHIRTHIPVEKQLLCPHCLFVTACKHHMEYHLRNHMGSKPFKCDRCNYQCINKAMLKSHMKSHENIYPYRCSECTYAAKYVHALNMHLQKTGHVVSRGVKDGIQGGGGRSVPGRSGAGRNGAPITRRNRGVGMDGMASIAGRTRGGLSPPPFPTHPYPPPSSNLPYQAQRAASPQPLLPPRQQPNQEQQQQPNIRQHQQQQEQQVLLQQHEQLQQHRLLQDQQRLQQQQEQGLQQQQRHPQFRQEQLMRLREEQAFRGRGQEMYLEGEQNQQLQQLQQLQTRRAMTYTAPSSMNRAPVTPQVDRSPQYLPPQQRARAASLAIPSRGSIEPRPVPARPNVPIPDIMSSFFSKNSHPPPPLILPFERALGRGDFPASPPMPPLEPISCRTTSATTTAAVSADESNIRVPSVAGQKRPRFDESPPIATFKGAATSFPGGETHGADNNSATAAPGSGSQAVQGSIRCVAEEEEVDEDDLLHRWNKKRRLHVPSMLVTSGDNPVSGEGKAEEVNKAGVPTTPVSPLDLSSKAHSPPSLITRVTPSSSPPCSMPTSSKDGYENCSAGGHDIIPRLSNLINSIDDKMLMPGKQNSLSLHGLPDRGVERHCAPLMEDQDLFREKTPLRSDMMSWTVRSELYQGTPQRVPRREDQSGHVFPDQSASRVQIPTDQWYRTLRDSRGSDEGILRVREMREDEGGEGGMTRPRAGSFPASSYTGRVGFPRPSSGSASVGHLDFVRRVNRGRGDGEGGEGGGNEGLRVNQVQYSRTTAPAEELENIRIPDLVRADGGINCSDGRDHSQLSSPAADQLQSSYCEQQLQLERREMEERRQLWLQHLQQQQQQQQKQQRLEQKDCQQYVRYQQQQQHPHHQQQQQHQQQQKQSSNQQHPHPHHSQQQQLHLQTSSPDPESQIYLSRDSSLHPDWLVRIENQESKHDRSPPPRDPSYEAHSASSASAGGFQAKAEVDTQAETTEVDEEAAGREGRKMEDDEGRIECRHCRIIFPDYVLYTLHMGYHSHDDPFRCNKCGHVSADHRQFFMHVARVAHE